ncbi:hypothetical protein TNCV_2818191 [Trichonephila clavipes]|nr:hypothetical protein TNCV_2818191 [Trichonephila clavipes]
MPRPKKSQDLDQENMLAIPSLYCFSFKKFLPKTSCSTFGIILHLEKENICSCSVRSVRTPVKIPAHTIKLPILLCDLFGTNIGLFQMPLARHTKTSLVSHSKPNADSLVNNT